MSLAWGTIFAAITLAAVAYLPIRDYVKRPKLSLEPRNRYVEKTKVRSFGFKVENKGYNIARDVGGMVTIDETSKSPIKWASDILGRESEDAGYYVDIRPGEWNSRRFFIIHSRGSERWTPREISVTLNWEYHGQRSKTYKFPGSKIPFPIYR